MSYPYPDALWVLEVPEATPSLNAFANKRSLYLYPRLRARWLSHLRDAWAVARSRSFQLVGFLPPPRARLTVHRYSPQPIDPDNLVGGLKPVIDALRKLGFIHDDDPAALVLEVRALRSPVGSTLLVLERWPLDPHPTEPA